MLLVGLYIGAGTMGNTMEIPQKLKQSCHITQQLHLWVFPEENKNINSKDICTMFTEALFTIVNT